MRRRHARWYGAALLLVLFGTTLVVYTVTKARPLLEGPFVEVAAPQPGSVVGASRVAVIGIARNVSRLSLNGRQIFIDERGIFREIVILAPGYTVLEVIGEDRFGRQTKAHVEVVRNMR